MRRMRGQVWLYSGLAVAAGVTAFGLQLYFSGAAPEAESVVSTLHPSSYRASSSTVDSSETPASDAKTKYGANRAIAGALSAGRSGEVTVATDTERSAKSSEKNTHEEPAADHPETHAAGLSFSALKLPGLQHLAAQLAENEKGELYLSHRVCTSAEYGGIGLENTRISHADWNSVLGVFHAAKDQLVSWVVHNQVALGTQTASWMKQSVEDLKIQRPPVLEEPDLGWRGIGIWTRLPGDGQSLALIRLGSGFIKLLNEDPQRAKFEMTRLVAQTWAPCEMKKVSLEASVWQPLLQCLDVAGDQSCGNGTFSESGWAVSTTLATLLAPPGCAVPAFNTVGGEACIKAASPKAVAQAEIRALAQVGNR